MWGGGTPNIGADIIGGLYSNASSVLELVNSDTGVGGLSILILSGEVQYGVETSGDSFYVLSVSLGVSALPVDMHGGMGYTKILEVSKHNGIMMPENLDMSYFSDLNCELQDKIAKDLNI